MKILKNKQTKLPSISFYNKYLINSIDISKDKDNNINNSFVISSNNPLASIKTFNKPKKDLILAKLDTSHLHKRNKNKKEYDNNNKTVNYDDSEGILMAAKLSSSFITEKNNYDSHIYYQKKKIRRKNEFDNNITKEKTSIISDYELFDTSPLEKLGKYNIQFDEKYSASTKIQSMWRRYYIRKKLISNIKINNFIKYLNKFIFKEFFKKLKNIIIKKKIYHKKIPEKNKNNNYELIKSCNSFRSNDLQIEQKINEITIFDKKNLQKKKKEKIKKFKEYSWMKFPFCLERYIKKQIKLLYFNLFFKTIKEISQEKLKEKKKILLIKLIHSNNIRNIKKYMNKYKENILIEKTKQNIYYSIIKSKKNNKNDALFNFQSFYKQNILRDIIKKYRYTSVVQKYYFLWKKKMDNKSKIKKKKFIKIKRIKKNEKEQNDLDSCKDDTISNVSVISNNLNYYNSNISNSIQSIKNIKGSLAVANKKMRIKKIKVDHKYYEYIENNNNYYSNFK